MSAQRFSNVSCSQCGRDFGPGEHGYSHCCDHQAASAEYYWMDVARRYQAEADQLQRWYSANVSTVPHLIGCAILHRIEALQCDRIPSVQKIIAAECAGWFTTYRGPYGVKSVGEAGVVREEFVGFHYPYQALAKAEQLEAAKGNRREVFVVVNEEDPESSVELEDEAYIPDEVAA